MNQHLAKQLAPDALGGTVPWHGAVPCSFPCRKVAHEARIAARYGVQTGSVDIDFARVMERMNEIRDGSREGLRSWLESEDAVTLFSGWGRFAGDKEIAVGETTVTGETIFVNVGPKRASRTFRASIRWTGSTTGASWSLQKCPTISSSWAAVTSG